MKTFEIKGIPRLNLVNLVGSTTGGSIAQGRALGKIFGQIEFSEAEIKRISVQQVTGADGVARQGVQFPADEPDFGKIAVKLEDTPAEVLAAMLEQAYQEKRMTALDLRQWAGDLIDALRKKE